MIRTILILLCHDLAFACKNRSVFLVLFIPLFVFALLQLADRNGAGESRINIGLVEGAVYAPELIEGLAQADTLLTVTWISNEAEGVELLQQQTLHGVLAPDDGPPGSLALLVLSRDSPQASAVLQLMATVQTAVEGGRTEWVSSVDSVRQGSAQRGTLPTWVLMLVLLVGFIILPMQVAEEKEKKLLQALLQTPIQELHWLLAKVLLGMLLVLVGILLLHVPGQFGVVRILDYVAIILAGAYCFSAFGILLGLLCRSQASARTLGVVFYVPLLLPAAMADVSAKLTAFAPWLPSWQLFRPVQALLLEDGRLESLTFDWIYLLLLGTLLLFLAHMLMKKRWP